MTNQSGDITHDHSAVIVVMKAAALLAAIVASIAIFGIVVSTI